MNEQINLIYINNLLQYNNKNKGQNHFFNFVN